MHNVSTLNLERVRQIKSRLVRISSCVQKVRDELEHLLYDDVDMAFLHLSEKLVYQASVGQSSRFDFYKQPPQFDEESDGSGHDVESEVLEEKDEENENETVIGFRPNLDELEMLLEAYFVQLEVILNKLNTFVAACKRPPVFCIFTEYMSRGSLRKYLHKQGPNSLPLKMVLKIALDVARGMNYLHSQGILHRD